MKIFFSMIVLSFSLTAFSKDKIIDIDKIKGNSTVPTQKSMIKCPPGLVMVNGRCVSNSTIEPSLDK